MSLRAPLLSEGGIEDRDGARRLLLLRPLGILLGAPLVPAVAKSREGLSERIRPSTIEDMVVYVGWESGLW